jgi:hypothetical protein
LLLLLIKRSGLRMNPLIDTPTLRERRDESHVLDLPDGYEK